MHEQTPAPPAEHPGPPADPTAPPPVSARGALIGQGVLVLVGAYVVYTSLGLELWGHLGPGPGFLPFVLGVALLLLAVSWFIQERARAARAVPASATPAQGAAEATDSGTTGGETPGTATAETATAETTTAETTAAETTDTPASGAGEGSAGRGHIISILGSLVVLGLVIDLLGFQLSMFAFLMFHLLRTRDVRWWVAVIIALVGSVGIFVLFGAGLGIQLPAAGIPFLANLGL